MELVSSWLNAQMKQKFTRHTLIVACTLRTHRCRRYFRREGLHPIIQTILMKSAKSRRAVEAGWLLAAGKRKYG
jgi:hypothetical protein